MPHPEVEKLQKVVTAAHKLVQPGMIPIPSWPDEPDDEADRIAPTATKDEQAT